MHIHSNTTQRVQEAPGARRGLASNRWSNSRPCVLPDLLRHASMNDLLAYETLDKYPPRRRLSRSPLVSPTYASMNDLHAYDTPPPFTLTSCLPDWQITTTNVGAAGAHETMLLVRIEARTRDYRGDGCSVARHGTRHHVCLRRDASMDRRCTHPSLPYIHSPCVRGTGETHSAVLVISHLLGLVLAGVGMVGLVTYSRKKVLCYAGYYGISSLIGRFHFFHLRVPTALNPSLSSCRPTRSVRGYGQCRHLNAV